MLARFRYAGLVGFVLSACSTIPAPISDRRLSREVAKATNTEKVELYEQNGRFLEAGFAAARLNQHGRAIDLFVKGRHFVEAASVAEMLGDDRTAGVLHESAGDHLTAAHFFEKCGDESRALRNHFAAKEKGKDGAYDLMRSMAKSLESKGDIDRAISLYELCAKELDDSGLLLSAAFLARKNYRFDKAFSNYERAGYLEIVSDDLMREAKRYLSVLAEEGRFVEAASLCIVIGDDDLRKVMEKYSLILREESRADNR